MQKRVVWQPVPPKEERAKVIGQARYVDHLAFPGRMHDARVWRFLGSACPDQKPPARRRR